MTPCPRCKTDEVITVDSRRLTSKGKNFVRRRGNCRMCGHRWTTYEGDWESVGHISDVGLLQIMVDAEKLKRLADTIITTVTHIRGESVESVVEQ